MNVYEMKEICRTKMQQKHLEIMDPYKLLYTPIISGFKILIAVVAHPFVPAVVGSIMETEE
jgi:hypothetical protein